MNTRIWGRGYVKVSEFDMAQHDDSITKAAIRKFFHIEPEDFEMVMYDFTGSDRVEKDDGSYQTYHGFSVAFEATVEDVRDIDPAVCEWGYTEE